MCIQEGRSAYRRELCIHDGGLHTGGGLHTVGFASEGCLHPGEGGLHPGGVCIQRGRVDLPKIHGILWDTVIKQAVCILLECILVIDCKGKAMSVCPQSASCLLVHYSALLRCDRYASYWNAFLFL